MTEADRISLHAGVDHWLAELVVIGANRTGSSIKALRGASKQRELVAARVWIALRARADGFSFPEIGRALNRDHTTIVHHCQRAGRDAAEASSPSAAPGAGRAAAAIGWPRLPGGGGRSAAPNAAAPGEDQRPGSASPACSQNAALREAARHRFQQEERTAA
ncbi:MAG TPA: helix-turn-helix domain-containing protein [Sphingomicrobium sp.]|nr:helix-turn-helix domain-containing protein [Sphingomicrobium sp.]